MYLPHYEWAICLFAVFSLWCWRWVCPRYGIAAASLLTYLCASSLWVWVWVENRYLPLNPYDQTAIRYFACDSAARMLLVMAPFLAFAQNKESFRFWGEIACGSFVFFNSLWIVCSLIWTGCTASNACGGAGNPSIMVGAMVCMLPIVIKSWRLQWWLLALVILAVLASHSSVALGLLALYFGYALLHGGYYKLALALIPLPIIAGRLLVGPTQLFFDSGRFFLWQYMMRAWSLPKNMPFGVGWGIYHVVSLPLQSYNRAHQDIASGFHWDAMHNDWLQGIFELGFTGGALMFGTYLTALCRMLKKREFNLAMSVALYGLYMGVNPALHHAVPAIFGAWLFVLALKKDGVPRQRPLYFYTKENVYV